MILHQIKAAPYRKQIERLRFLDTIYSHKEENIKKIIQNYVQQISPGDEDKLSSLEKSGLHYPKNLEIFKENIQYIARAHDAFHLGNEVTMYLKNAEIVLKDADSLWTFSGQRISLKEEVSERIDGEKPRVTQNEKLLIEFPLPKIEVKETQTTEEEVPKAVKSDDDAHFIPAPASIKAPSQIPLPIMKPIKSNEIPQNLIADKTTEIDKSKQDGGTGNAVLMSEPNFHHKLEFGSNEGLILTDTAPIKAKKSGNHELTATARIFDWSKINVSKMATGSIGEELVLKFEKDRLIALGMGELAARIEHSSKVKGDGLGYDILSFSESMDVVFIEVKATTGGFWNGIVFTKNEIEFMNKCGKAYRLYRIFEIDKKSKTGKICIFSGSKAVNEFFNFVPQSFSAKPK